MPFTPQAIKERKRRVTFDFDGYSVNFDYRAEPVENITQEQWDSWQEALTTPDDADAGVRFLAGLVCEFVTWWDCVESIAEDGTLGAMWPLEVDSIKGFDPTFLARIFFEMMKDAAEAKKFGTTA